MYTLFIFDLDGTLTESKQSLTSSMEAKLTALLACAKVGIISGGAFPQFIKQVVKEIPEGATLENLYLLPTSGAALYEYQSGGWDKIYEERLSEKEAHMIKTVVQEAAEALGLINFSEEAWGERIEHRGGQVTLSALGQEAPLALKKAWDPDHKKRHLLRDAISEQLPEYSVAIGGTTSIDVSKKGIDKAYGVRKLCERLHIPESEALYVGDELESGGNDEAVYQTAVAMRAVQNPAETAKLIEELIHSIRLTA